MKVKNISYPHPVLGNGDDVQGTFDPYYTRASGRDVIALRFDFKLKNKTLEKLIKEKKAVYTVEAECSSTFYRTSFATSEREAVFEIKADKVRDEVSLGFFIRATESIKKYVVEGCHDDYKGFTSEISSGDVLAVAGYSEFVVEKDFDPLKPSISSFIAIKQGQHERGIALIDYDDPDKIVIKLPKADWRNWRTIINRDPAKPVLHAAIVLPVLADAIALVEKGDEQSRDYHWFKRLRIILDEKGFAGENALTAAQKILQQPIERALNGMVELSNQDAGD